MKYMKLGSKPDIFRADGNLRTLVTEVDSDVVIEVDNIKLHLHKFPLLAKCGGLQKLMAEAANGVVRIQDIPGGVEAFELCAKFCYGITITLSAYNVISVRCAAEYLEMTENMDKGNLIFKLEVFLNSSVFQSWKDSIIALKTCKAVYPWSQDLQLVSRCIDSIASKTSVDPLKVNWSFTYTRTSPLNGISACGSSNSPPWDGNSNHRSSNVPKDWWVEDICDLEVDLYWRVMLSIKSKGRMSHKLIGEALRVYTYKWLPAVSIDHNQVETLREGSGGPDEHVVAADKHRILLETIVSLLPSEKGSCSCSFMLRMLKAANILGAANSSKMELESRIGMQLEDASLSDLLIPSPSYVSDCVYDVDLVQRIVKHFMLQDHSPLCSSPPRGHRDREKRRSRSADQLELLEFQKSVTYASKLRVAKLIDGYLAEIARDPKLPLSKFMALAESIPKFARPVHDGLYRAIDIYLKEHPSLTKSERKKICSFMDCKKLSMDACVHAAQNERLPVRVVVQVLFFEQVRTATSGGLLLSDLPSNVKALLPQRDQSHPHQENSMQAPNLPEEEWESVHHDFNALKKELAQMKQKIAEAEREKGTTQQQGLMKHSKTKKLMCGSKKILGRLWSLKNNSSGGSKDSDVSKSSGSSVNSAVLPGEDVNAIKGRRNSIS